jgi:hypothetical protein
MSESHLAEVGMVELFQAVEEDLLALRSERDALAARLRLVEDELVGTSNECSILKRECERRFRFVLQSQEQDLQMKRMQQSYEETLSRGAALQAQLQEAREQSELLLLQLQQVQEELVRKASPEAIDVTSDWSAQATHGLEAERQAARAESELLLLQLHQVQEELEHYFLRCQELENREDLPPDRGAAASASDVERTDDDLVLINQFRARLMQSKVV